ncbi:hypothetical protein SLE2022_324420 [Rubroshorea leprosula]|uniref:Homeobox domain-containing protein n=1 Tax=Rubroshorea leprosula TaxID=152421 RepID=A0AAV5K7V5_9ROSI|nr:hypothetical protein SLEP1_g30185 [Rubroshorea leprosula]
MGFDDIPNFGLPLNLGLGLGSCLVEQENFSQSDHQRRKKKFSSLNINDHQLFPSLTLGPSASKGDHQSGDHHQQASSLSAASSFSNSSVKKERDFGSEEVELERVSSRLSDEDEEGSPRKKLRLTKEQSAILEESFKEHSTLNPKQKQVLAEQLNLRPRQVEVWFQNRRARTKLKQTELDCELLKKCCETLTEENKRLQKEVQELKSMKVTAAQYFMQLPAATLTMCPSCERVTGGSGSGDVGSPSRPFTVGQKSHFYNPFSHHPSAAY